MTTTRTATETKVLRYQTRDYIASAPSTIRFIPYPENTTAAGGKARTAGVPRAPQVIRLVPLDRRAPATRLLGQRPNDGDLRADDLEILGEWDLDIARGDQFTWDGTTYEVTEVQPIGSASYLRRAFARGLPVG